MLYIEELHFIRPYLMDILLNNKEHFQYDMQVYLNTARFADIANEDIFENGKLIKGKLIRWNMVTELSLSEILVKKDGNKNE